jgi:hypothetical protein
MRTMKVYRNIKIKGKSHMITRRASISMDQIELMESTSKTASTMIGNNISTIKMIGYL